MTEKDSLFAMIKQAIALHNVQYIVIHQRVMLDMNDWSALIGKLNFAGATVCSQDASDGYFEILIQSSYFTVTQMLAIVSIYDKYSVTFVHFFTPFDLHAGVECFYYTATHTLHVYDSMTSHLIQRDN